MRRLIAAVAITTSAVLAITVLAHGVAVLAHIVATGGHFFIPLGEIIIPRTMHLTEHNPPPAPGAPLHARKSAPRRWPGREASG